MHIEGTQRCHAKEKTMDGDENMYNILNNKCPTTGHRLHSNYFMSIVLEND